MNIHLFKNTQLSLVVVRSVGNINPNRNFNSDPEVNWKALFKASEDSFTSSIFGLLLYLPAEQFWDIIKNAAQIKPDIGFPGQVFGNEFWPPGKPKQVTDANQTYIEFENLNLIVEAKRYDGEQQLEYQWQTELEAYHESIASDKPVCLLAAGGIRNGSIIKTKTRDRAKVARSFNADGHTCRTRSVP